MIHLQVYGSTFKRLKWIKLPNGQEASSVHNILNANRKIYTFLTYSNAFSSCNCMNIWYRPSTKILLWLWHKSTVSYNALVENRGYLPIPFIKCVHDLLLLLPHMLCVSWLWLSHMLQFFFFFYCRRKTVEEKRHKKALIQLFASVPFWYFHWELLQSQMILSYTLGI